MSKSDHDHDRDSDHANDNGEHERSGGKQVASAPAGGALTSLAVLQTALANVNTAAIIGRSGLPMMLFKAREGSGAWGYGQRRIIPEPDSRWAINPLTFQRGYIAFGPDKKVLGEHLASIAKPMIDVTTLPNVNAPWQEEWTVNMKCLDGADAGVEVIFKANTDGGIKAIVTLVELVRNQIDRGQDEHKGKIAPIAKLERDSYPHPQYGKTNIPVLTVVDWMPLDGPAPVPAEPVPPQSPPEQPRRRRVA